MDGPDDRLAHIPAERRSGRVRTRELPVTSPSRSTAVWIFVPLQSTPAAMRVSG
jgi:hypothetical protein